MITIYSDNLAISLNDNTTEIPSTIKNIVAHNNSELIKVIETIHNDGYHHDINIYGYNSTKMLTDFCKMHKCIDAAGGVVNNKNSKYLLIKRFGIWDLPKGKVETGETNMDAAVREVCEETGLLNIKITKSIPDTYHIYKQHNTWYLKKTYWFLMETKDKNELIPQTKEGITEAVWMKKKDALVALSNSYRSLYDNLGYLFR